MSKIELTKRDYNFGEVYLAEGASGAGKTRLLINKACQLGLPRYFDGKEWVENKDKKSVTIIFDEVTREEIMIRFVSAITSIPSERLLFETDELTEHEKELITEAKSILEEAEKTEALRIVSIRYIAKEEYEKSLMNVLSENNSEIYVLDLIQTGWVEEILKEKEVKTCWVEK